MAIIFIFIYSLLTIRIDASVSMVMTWAFLGGLVVDIFSDTLGINTMASLILAVVRRPIYFSYVAKDDRTKNVVPSSRNLGFANYAKYILTATGIFCVILFTLEYLSYINIIDILLYSICSTFATFIVILGLDSLLEGKQSAH